MAPGTPAAEPAPAVVKKKGHGTAHGSAQYPQKPLLPAAEAKAKARYNEGGALVAAFLEQS